MDSNESQVPHHETPKLGDPDLPPEGMVNIADSKNFTASRTIAAALVKVEPGSMRELHWHPNADEWQYYMQGSARMTVFNTGPHANTTAKLVSAHLNIPEETLAKFPRGTQGIVPLP